MTEPVVRTIYDNYDLWDTYVLDARFYLTEDQGKAPEEITEDDIWHEIYEQDELQWENTKYELEEFFDGSASRWLAVGAVGRWNGTFKGGFIFKTFNELLSKVGRDCAYFSFTDVNGHFYMKCSHHDGTNEVEVRQLTRAGEQLLDNWSNSASKRYAYSEEELHKRLFEKHSTRPNYAHQVYGCPLREAKKVNE